jgi:hypothetical protein
MKLQTTSQNKMIPQEQTTQPSSLNIKSPVLNNKRNRISRTLSSSQPTAIQLLQIDKSYKAQCDHLDAAAQTSNRHRRVSINRGAVANLRQTNNHNRQLDTRIPQAHKKPPQNKQQKLLRRVYSIPSTTTRRCSTAHMNEPANYQSKQNE